MVTSSLSIVRVKLVNQGQVLKPGLTSIKPSCVIVVTSIVSITPEHFIQLIVVKTFRYGPHFIDEEIDIQRGKLLFKITA